MALERLGIREFRCFSRADLTLSPQHNLLTGANAAGKTSVLEAIFVLSRGRSFRTRHLAELVRYGQTGFQVFGQAGATALGIEYTANGVRARCGGAPAASQAALAERLPVQLLNTQAHLLIEGGPSHRRRFLDWGAFHVEPSFWPAWRRYQRCLRQRNALLRQGGGQRLLTGWTTEFLESGAALDGARRAYFERWQPTALELAAEMLDDSAVDIAYRRGWPEQQELAVALSRSADRERRAGATQVGPHRAGFLVRVGQVPARARISRGQQKALAMALLLAQALLYRDMREQPCLLLIDDIAAELDATHLARFGRQLVRTQAQTVLSAICRNSLPPFSNKALAMFHVERSRVQKVV
jgi:DNA replication and repair protein RecF